MHVVFVPAQEMVYGPFKNETEAHAWAACNPVTDLDGLDPQVIELASPLTEDEEMTAPEFRLHSGERPAKGLEKKLVPYFPIMLVHDETESEWQVGEFTSESIARVAIEALNGLPELLSMSVEAARSEIGKPMMTWLGYQRRLKEKVDATAAFKDTWESEGFEWWHTGGGCTAWYREMETDKGEPRWILVTEDASIPQEGDEQFEMGIYGPDSDDSTLMDDECLEYRTWPNELKYVLEAIAWAENIIDPTLKATPCTVCDSIWSPRTGCMCQGEAT